MIDVDLHDDWLEFVMCKDLKPLYVWLGYRTSRLIGHM